MFVNHMVKHKVLTEQIMQNLMKIKFICFEHTQHIYLHCETNRNRHFFIFFLSRYFFFHMHWRFTAQQGKGADHLYSSPPLPPAHEHSDIYLQLLMWDGYHLFSITSLATARLLRDTSLLNYHLINWWWNVNLCFFAWGSDSRFLLQQLGTGNHNAWGK